MKYLICGDFTATEENSDLFRQGEDKTLFNDVLDVIKSSDRVFVNIETALTDSDGKIEKYGPHLKTPPETAQLLKKIGVTDCGLSNNHIFDYGPEGALDTIKFLTDAGMEVTGFGNNAEDARKNHCFVTPEGKRVVLIAVSDREYAYALEDRMGARVYDEYDTILDIRDAKKDADFVIVIYHGGKEFSRYPSPRLRKSCQAMIKHGADAVICQHTHCVGCYEKFEGGHILYGQGNFHFAREHHFEGWNDGLMVMLDITDKCEISFIPCVRRGVGIRLANEAEAVEIMDGFNKRNEELKTDAWRDGWHQVCEENRTLYEWSVKNTSTEDKDPIARQIFAHYLDCEAHCDIYRELFPTWNKTNCK